MKVVKVDPHDTFRKEISDGETWENVLIDITAPGATYFISARANNWTIRNIGVRGAMDSGREVNPFRVEVPNRNANGTIENVYLGDGDEGTYASHGAQISGIWAVWTHAGHIDVKNLHVAGFSDGNFYCSAPGNSSDHPNPGHGGTLAVYDSYSADGDISNWRLGTDGSKLVNCVSWNGTHRGLKQPFGTVEVRDCDFGPSSSPTPIDVGTNNWDAGFGAETVVRDSRFNDNRTVEKNVSRIDGGSVGEPEHRIPGGVPMSAEEAASGSSNGVGFSFSSSSFSANTYMDSFTDSLESATAEFPSVGSLTEGLTDMALYGVLVSALFVVIVL